MVIASGNGQHAYWSLWPPVGPAEAERANRRLAHALGADMQATDAARILRPPGTFNFKTGRPVPVTVERLEPEVYTVEQVVGELRDPEPERSRSVSPMGDGGSVSTMVDKRAGDDPLLTIPPAVYVEALTGRTVGRDGKLACPFHEDGTPSLHVYDDPNRGWVCFGCGRGGT